MSGAAFRRNLDVFVQDNLTAEARSAKLARFARAALADVQQRGEGSKQVTRFVDGREGVPEETVRPNGVILYRFGRLAPAIAFALSYLRARSPGTNYTAGFFVGVSATADIDGRPIPAAMFNPATMGGDARTVTIGNSEPYNRRVDVQMDGTRALRFSVPPNLYADCAAQVQRRFPGLVARRVYTLDMPGQYRLKTGPRAGKPVHSPAIVITTA
jgi:hypothetical protein